MAVVLVTPEPLWIKHPFLGCGAVYSRVANVPKSPMLPSEMELIFGGILVLIFSFIIGRLV